MIQENFIQLFQDSFQQNYDLPAYSNFGEQQTLSYGQVAQEIAKLHILFTCCGIQPNDKIALIGKNDSNWAISYLATVTYGAVIVPILQDFNSENIHHIIEHSESKLLFVSDTIWKNLDEQQLSTLNAVLSLSDFSPIAIHSKADGCSKKISPSDIQSLFEAKYKAGFSIKDIQYVQKSNDELVCLNYTSGTTGFSKGVMLSGNSLAGNITFGIQTGLLRKGYNIVSFLPLAHTYGCAFDFLTATTTGCHTHFLVRTPVAQILLKAFAEIRPNVIFCVPLIIEKIYKKQIQPLLSKRVMKWALRTPLVSQLIINKIREKLINAFGGNFSEIVVGGAPLNAEVEAFFRKIKFPFTVGYGMTECGPLISYANKNNFIPKSSGKILDTMNVKIDQPHPNTGIGEIFVKGEHVMQGYYKNPEATAAVLDSQGWLHTGDLGTVDESGNIFIRGRNKSMILTANGQNIYPEEIEAKLNNLPYVMESLVIEKENKLIALVYPDHESIRTHHISEKNLQNIMEENKKTLNNLTANYENIAQITLHPTEFEKTPKKSIKRYLYTTH